MDTPDLIIPVRMDVGNAIKQLQKLGGAGKKPATMSRKVQGKARKGFRIWKAGPAMRLIPY